MITALIIEDEVRNQRMLSKLINEQCPHVKILGIEETVAGSISSIRAQKPDLILLDIQLKDGSGFDILTELTDHIPSVIFTTAYDQFAVRAFKHSAIDYLLKPIVAEELVHAIDKVKPNPSVMLDRLNMLLEKVDKHHEKYIKVSSQRHIQFLRIPEILRLEAQGNYTCIVMKDGSKHTVSKVLKEYDKYLTEHDFYRVHQSHLINLGALLSYDKSNQILTMSNGDKVPVSRNVKEQFLIEMGRRSLG